eukprot:762196-Prorocentrum_minimum.AAC.5
MASISSPPVARRAGKVFRTDGGTVGVFPSRLCAEAGARSRGIPRAGRSAGAWREAVGAELDAGVLFGGGGTGV